MRIFSYIFVFFILIYFGFNSLYEAPPWIDEILTYFHSKGGNFDEFIVQTECGLNRMPPLYFLFTKVFIPESSFFYSARFLSTLFSVFTFYYLTKIARFWIDWNKSIFISSITLFSSDLFIYHTYEARPYSLCLMLVTMLCFLILRYEIMQKSNTCVKFLIGLVCFLLPAIHYTYSISSFFLGSTHILFTNKRRSSLICIYFSAGLLFLASHLNLFLIQQNFGNLLAMIDYPSFFKIVEYVKIFFPPLISLLFILILLFIYILRKYFFKYNNSIQFITIFPVLFLIVLLFGILVARIFPNDIWFLPRYYLGGILILPFSFILIFANSKAISSKLNVFLPFLSILIICINLYFYRSHRLHIYSNPQMYCYSFYPDKNLDKYQIPVITDDPVLFFHYLLNSNNTYFLTNSEKEKIDFQKFTPNHCKNIIHSVQYNSFIYITANYNKSKFKNYLQNDVNILVSPIHLAKIMQKI